MLAIPTGSLTMLLIPLWKLRVLMKIPVRYTQGISSW
jgi:hypothetical protein